MMRNKRTFRWTCLGLLCGGLLLAGIGAGVQLVEASALTYGGEKLVQNNTQSVHMVVDLNPEAERVNILSHGGRLSEQFRELGRIETRDTVTPGTVELDFSYEGSEMTISYWSDYDDSETFQWVNLYWDTKSELSTLLACKDQVLEDLKQGQISDYVLWNLTEAVITVHPDDAARIYLG